MAVNEGLAIGLSLGIGIPLAISFIVLAVVYGRRRHPKLPQPDACRTQNTENWLDLYRATRPRSFVEKICSILESLRVLRKPIVQEVYMMEDGAKVPK
ncbi:hypothetical protein N7516_007971 [Penicillium verrucosum]|uniref:uncharacterized protein n=1 Tax=Penicillium verrucosum TaxID=60171 RepID=UPI0025455E08|nr:uncharacterized protein N7516_007971 [Penicillium verrucosum]KAJ5926198.1 hypothetical protein N7516_007971 [Penicillium verrucosum]